MTDERVGRLVKTVLFKSYFLYCQQAGIEFGAEARVVVRGE